MSPERIQGDNYGVESDVWSLGLTLLEVCFNFEYYKNKTFFILFSDWIGTISLRKRNFLINLLNKNALLFIIKIKEAK